MRTNDLKKGTRVRLRSGLEATLLDSKRGVVRPVKVTEPITDHGSIYAYEIVAYQEADGTWRTDIEYTKGQLEQKKINEEVLGDSSAVEIGESTARADALEYECIEEFRKGNYVECAQMAFQQTTKSHLLFQLQLICFQRVEYPGIERAGDFAIRMFKSDPWARVLLELTLGKVDFEEVLPLATSPEKRCQAHYYHGSRLVLIAMQSTEVEDIGKNTLAACTAFARSRNQVVECAEYELAGIDASMIGCTITVVESSDRP